METGRIIRLAVLAVLGIVTLILFVAFAPFTTVKAGNRAVVTVFGDVRPGSLLPGFNFINPIAKVHEINVQIQKADVKGDAASKDLQHVNTNLTINYHIDAGSVDRLYSEIGMSYEAKVLDGTAQDAFKAVTSQYTAEELISKREAVRQAIKSALANKVKQLSNGTIDVDDVFITNFDFSKEFNSAIEAKQQADQLAQKATRDLQRIEVEAKQRIAQATAEAEAIRIQASAIQAQGGAAYVSLKATEKWNGVMPQFVGSAMPFIQMPMGTK